LIKNDTEREVEQHESIVEIIGSNNPFFKSQGNLDSQDNLIRSQEMRESMLEPL
jgi:hypothetical protein